MRTCLISYATPAYREWQQRLEASAERFNIDEIRSWSRARLERTEFYRTQRAILDLPRGSGYWLWKPYIISEALDEMDAEDVLFYSDAGMEIVGDLSVVAELARAKGGLLLFAGHYDDFPTPGPNVCRRWTKRDCFVLMDCDDAAYHDARMIDASFIVLMSTEGTRAFIRQWLRYCTVRAILTDEPNAGGLDDLPGFVEHRHDQSVLSLLAIRHGLELFRHPSQFGNHLKTERFRAPGEMTRRPYGSHGIFENSPYPTLLDHHRGARSREVMTGQAPRSPRLRGAG